MTISVAIATYNRASMVKEAIEAALVQSRPPDEIVVSDDASSDHTGAVLEEVASRNPRVRVLRQESNSGGVENWNAAMRATQGDFIAWCSDDDRFTPDHLLDSLEFLESNPHIGVVHSGFIDSIERGATRQDGAQTAGAETGEADAGGFLDTERYLTHAARPLRSPRPILVNARNLTRYMIRYCDWPFHPSTLAMRRDVWKRTGEFDPAYALADTDWFVRAAAVTTIALLPRRGVINRRHAGNWSNRLGSAYMQREIFEIVERTLVLQPPIRRAVWRALWRANVRARLALTLRARVRSGFSDAACAAWHGILQDTGRSVPHWIERTGERIIRRLVPVLCNSEAAIVDSRQSVSPL